MKGKKEDDDKDSSNKEESEPVIPLVPAVVQMGQVVKPAQKNLPHYLYDEAQLQEELKKYLLNVTLLAVIHYKWEAVLPILLQSVTAPLNLLSTPIVQAYIIGPFLYGKLGLDFFYPGNLLSKEEESRIKNSEEANLGDWETVNAESLSKAKKLTASNLVDEITEVPLPFVDYSDVASLCQRRPFPVAKGMMGDLQNALAEAKKANQSDDNVTVASSEVQDSKRESQKEIESKPKEVELPAKTDETVMENEKAKAQPEKTKNQRQRKKIGGKFE